MLLRDASDRRGQRGREQRDLASARNLLEDPLDVIDETHLQHLVGLVEHERRDAAEVEGAALDVIHDPTGRADDDVRATLEAHQLRRVTLAAINGQDVKAFQVRGITLEGLGHLDRKFARRDQHEPLRRAAFDLPAAQHRQRERSRLAGARLGLAEHVLACQQHGNRGGLDRRRRLVPRSSNSFEHG